MSSYIFVAAFAYDRLPPVHGAQGLHQPGGATRSEAGMCRIAGMRGMGVGQDATADWKDEITESVKVEGEGGGRSVTLSLQGAIAIVV
jgi:hypothetical protein